jgi:hypothetical protein
MDCRDVAAHTYKWYRIIDRSRMVASVEVSDDCNSCDDKEECSGYEVNGACDHEVEVPIKFEVCGVCRGKGTHVNPSIDGNGISPEEFDQDPEFYQEYRRGSYDVECYECKGERVVPAIDELRAGKELSEKINKHIYDVAQAGIDDARAARMGY